MMTELIWLTTAAKEVLSASAQLLGGQVPCPPAALAAALQKAEGNASLGLLGDAELRNSFAKALESPSGFQELNTESGSQLVDLFAKVLQDKLQSIKVKAKEFMKKLPTAGAASYAAVLEACKKDSLPQVLQRDWVLWHSVGSGHYPKDVPALPAAVVNERIALLACVGDSPLADIVVKSHVLEHLDKYQSWEASMTSSKPQAPSSGVKTPFEASVAKQVSLRRALSQAFPVDVATKASEADGGYTAALKSLAAKARASAVLPKYVVPKDAADKEPGKKRKADSAAPGGGFAALHKSTESQEYRWHMLAYSINPQTTLGASVSKGSKLGSSRTEASSAAPGAASESKPAGFAGVWAPGGNMVPPGHTPYSWHHQASGMKEGFSTIWASQGSQCPPGHTPYSWEKALNGDGATPASSSRGAKKASPAAPKAESGKAAAEPKASPKAQPAANAPPAESKEAALAKIDLRCGRILECERHPDADSLYLLKINIGEDQPRQVVSSLVKHYKETDLKDRQVMVYCNIKPGKMRGLESQAMVLAATKNKGAEDEVCELLDPPKGCKEGTRPIVGSLEVGSGSEGVSVKNISKVWGVVQPSLQMSDTREATFEGTTLMMKEGPVTAKSLSSVGIY